MNAHGQTGCVLTVEEVAEGVELRGTELEGSDVRMIKVRPAADHPPRARARRLREPVSPRRPDARVRIRPEDHTAPGGAREGGVRGLHSTASKRARLRLRAPSVGD